MQSRILLIIPILMSAWEMGSPSGAAAANSAPVANPDSVIAFEDGADLVIDVLANDSDADESDTKKVVAVDGPLLQGARVTVAADELSISYAVLRSFQNLTAGETETETFSYTMADAEGAQSTAQVTVTVIGVNDAPVAVDDFESTRVTEDSGPLRFDVLRNDTDPDGDPRGSDTKTVVSVDTTTASTLGGVSIIEEGGALEYSVGDAFQSLTAGQSAIDIFSHTIQDDSGVQRTATVEVTVIGADEHPPPGSLFGSAFDDVINTTSLPPLPRTTEGADIVYGLSGDDTIDAAGGTDTLIGGPGRDLLDGGAGDDFLTGNGDRDELTGAAGADTFVFEWPLDSETLDPDRVQDFSAGEGDLIDLRLIDADTLAAGNNAFTLIGGTTFTNGVPGQLIFDPTTNLLQGDVNGDAAADFAISLRLVVSLNSADLML